MEKIQISRISSAQALTSLDGMQHLDPSGMCQPDDIIRMTEQGECFAAVTTDSQAVYVLAVKNGVCWINATKGQGVVNWANVLFSIIEAQAKDCDAVAFQTKSRGLVRRAKRQGYAVTGWILKKAIS